MTEHNHRPNSANPPYPTSVVSRTEEATTSRHHQLHHQLMASWPSAEDSRAAAAAAAESSRMRDHQRYLPEAAVSVGLTSLGDDAERHHSSTYLIAWLHENYEQQGNASMTKEELYQDYLGLCAQEGMSAQLPSMFGKLVHRAFPGLRSSRVGARGQSKHCYKCFRRKRDAPTDKTATSTTATVTAMNIKRESSRPTPTPMPTIGKRRRSLSFPSFPTWEYEEEADEAAYMRDNHYRRHERETSVGQVRSYTTTSTSRSSIRTEMAKQAPSFVSRTATGIPRSATLSPTPSSFWSSSDPSSSPSSPDLHRSGPPSGIRMRSRTLTPPSSAASSPLRPSRRAAANPACFPYAGGSTMPCFLPYTPSLVSAEDEDRYPMASMTESSSIPPTSATSRDRSKMTRPGVFLSRARRSASSYGANRDLPPFHAEDIHAPAYISPLEVNDMPRTRMEHHHDQLQHRGDRASLELENFRSFLSMLGSTDRDAEPYSLASVFSDGWQDSLEWYIPPACDALRQATA